MATLVWIPARSGSVRLPNKNLSTVGGASLVARAVWTARRLLAVAGFDGKIVVDTDDVAIRDEALSHGAEVPFLREPEYSGDTAGSAETALRCAERLEALGFSAEALVVLQPTSPLGDLEHLVECWNRFVSGPGGVISVRRADVEASSAMLMSTDGGLTKIPLGGEGPGEGSVYCPSGAFYAASRRALSDASSFYLPGHTVGVETLGPAALDVDYEYQLELADGFAHRAVARGPERCEVIAEAGVNHNGDRGLALELVDIAAEAGADFVKFQTFDTTRLVSETAEMAAYQIENTGTQESQLEMLQALMLTPELHEELVARCASRGIGFMSTPFDDRSADFLVELGVSRLKVPSGEITNWGFLEHVASLGLPLLLSTGMSTLGEVMDAVERVEAGGCVDLTLLHCVSNYPAAPSDTNLRAMDTLRSVFGGRVGLSDHTLGVAVAFAAAARGASVLEKHFTVDRGLPGPDHAASLEPAELRALVSGIREIESAMGDGVKRPREPELPVAAVARRSLHAVADLPKGKRLTIDDVTALRPGTGIPPSELARVVGGTLVRAVDRGSMLSEADLG